jgi:hypothetical protein
MFDAALLNTKFDVCAASMCKSVDETNTGLTPLIEAASTPIVLCHPESVDVVLGLAFVNPLKEPTFPPVVT